MNELHPSASESSSPSVLETLPDSKSSLGRVLSWCVDHSPALAPLAEIARMKAEPEQPDFPGSER